MTLDHLANLLAILILGMIIGLIISKVYFRLKDRRRKKKMESRLTDTASIAYYHGGEIRKIPYEGTEDDWPKR